MKIPIFVLLLTLANSDFRQTSKVTDFMPGRLLPTDQNLLFPSPTSALPLLDAETCLVEEERIMKVGEVIIPDSPKCYKITCLAKDTPVFEGCPSIKVRKNCHGSFYNMTKTYPNCCPKEVCP